MKEIINFTKPYTDKNMYVEITFDNETATYEINGIDCFGERIEQASRSYSKIGERFYMELCWMLNEDLMANTARQRITPMSASKKYKPVPKICNFQKLQLHRN